jgi:hypothetical protein
MHERCVEIREFRTLCSREREERAHARAAIFSGQRAR